MTILKKNGNKKIKNYFDYRGDSSATLKHKRSILASLKLDTPLLSWPKDRLTLLSIINTYLANLQLAKLDKEVAEEKKEKLEVIDDLLDVVGSFSAYITDNTINLFFCHNFFCFICIYLCLYIILLSKLI